MVAPNKKAAKWLLLILVLAGGVGGAIQIRTILEALVQQAACKVLFSCTSLPLWNGSGTAVVMCFLLSVLTIPKRLKVVFNDACSNDDFECDKSSFPASSEQIENTTKGVYMLYTPLFVCSYLNYCECHDSCMFCLSLGMAKRIADEQSNFILSPPDTT